MKSCLNRKSFIVVGFCVAVLGLTNGVVAGKTITVRADGTGDYPTIQAAINVANAGDEIVCADGTYTGNGNRDIDFRGKTITVKSKNGPENCIIDCNGTETDPHRGFYFHSGENANSVLAGFKIINGYASPEEVERYKHKLWVIAGGIYCARSNPTIKNCILADNFALEWGGGMYFENSSASTYDCRITSNSAGEGAAVYTLDSEPTFIRCDFNKNWIADQFGSAIFFQHGAPTIIDSNITNNSSEVFVDGIYCQHSNAKITNCLFTGNSGRGIRVWGMTPIIINCVFRNNSGPYGMGITARCSGIIIQNCLFESNSSDYNPYPYGGGAICLFQSPAIYGLPNPIISNCIILGNSTTYHGGAIFCYDNISPLITNCFISGNTASRAGGAIYCSQDCSPTLNNCTIVGNKAGTSGGAVSCNNSASPTLNNCTIVGNKAGTSGGAVSCNSSASPTIINNSILSSNIGQDGFQVVLGSEKYPSNLIISYSNIEGGQSTAYVDKNCSLIWEQNNIEADTMFTEPGYWADGNDPNMPVEPNHPNAVWVKGDYHLLPSSPCIDAGDPNYIAGPNETDIDGEPRVFGERIDMGAYEAVYINTAPVACIVGGDRMVEVGIGCEARVILDGSCSSDADSTPGTNDDIEYFDWYEVIDVCDPNSDIFLGSGEIIECNLPLGERDIVLEVTDKAGAFDANEVAITVEDSKPPEFSLSVAPSVLWPPNHKMVLITPSWEVSDNCDEWPEVTLVGITMNGDGATTEDDIQIGDDGIYLRAERGGKGNGRVYTITYQAVDDSGNITIESAAVTVPHDRRKPK